MGALEYYKVSTILYIDPLLDRLRRSGYGCHIKGVYMGALSYADHITIMCPSMNLMKC